MELDGEYFAVERPHSIYIQQSEEFANGKINIVTMKKKEVRLNCHDLDTQLIDFEGIMAALTQEKTLTHKQKNKK